MSYPRSRTGRRTGITSHGNAAGTHKHQKSHLQPGAPLMNQQQPHGIHALPGPVAATGGRNGRM